MLSKLAYVNISISMSFCWGDRRDFPSTVQFCYIGFIILKHIVCEYFAQWWPKYHSVIYKRCILFWLSCQSNISIVINLVRPLFTQIFLVTGDVTVKEDVQRIMDSTVQHYGRLDVLLNNAGATRARNIDTCTIEDLDWCYNVLVRSVFMMSKAAIPHLEKTKGAILNMSSLAGLRPVSISWTFQVIYMRNAAPVISETCAFGKFHRIVLLQ